MLNVLKESWICGGAECCGVKPGREQGSVRQGARKAHLERAGRLEQPAGALVLLVVSHFRLDVAVRLRVCGAEVIVVRVHRRRGKHASAEEERHDRHELHAPHSNRPDHQAGCFRAREAKGPQSGAVRWPLSLCVEVKCALLKFCGLASISSAIFGKEYSPTKPLLHTAPCCGGALGSWVADS